MSSPSATGKVYLVGGGPGDPGLLTLKGYRCLQQADFILYDGLVNPLLLRHANATTERTARADRSGRRTLEQEQINQRLIEEAKLGKAVVRLKGGDPYIFGRGSEEASALRQAGIEFEVVPGITSATAAAEYAGFSLTHRDHASAVCLVTGHEDPTKEVSSLDYEILAKFPGTLVFYMGLHRIKLIADSLIEAGLSPETPAAVVTRASTPLQRVVSGVLSELPEKVTDAGLTPPSLIMVGPAVQLREQINWFDRKPLLGKRIGITRPSHQVEEQIQQSIDLGAQPVLMPLIEIEPVADQSDLDLAVNSLQQYEWIIFTSSNGVVHFFERLLGLGYDVRHLGKTKIACIGSSTAATLREFYVKADLVPESYCSEGLVEELLKQDVLGPVLWPRANRGRDVIANRLAEQGIELQEVVAYEHVDATSLTEEVTMLLDKGQLDWIGLSSPAIASRLVALLTDEQHKQIGEKVKLAAISPITAAELEKQGMVVSAVASEYTWDGIFKAIERAEKQG